MDLRLILTSFSYFLKSLLLFFLSFCFCITNVFGQGWERSFGSKERPDEGKAVIQTIDQGYLTVGFSESFGEDNDTDVFVVKTDVDGTTVWSQIYDEAFQERAFDVMQTPDGGFLIAGEIQETPGALKDVYLLRISPNGTFIWSKKWSNGKDEDVQSIAKGFDGGYILAGESRDPETGDSDFLIIKIDEAGNEEWSKVFGQLSKDDKINAITNTRLGYTFVGNTERIDGFENDIAVRGIDQNGNEIWERDLSSSEVEEGNDIITTSDGNVVITGQIGQNLDAFAAKYTPEGEQLWLTSLDDPFGNRSAESGNAITELSDGSLAVVGFVEISGGVNIDILMFGLTENGENLWINRTGDRLNTDFGEDITATHDGGFIVAGSNSDFLNFVSDVSLVKTDGEGNTITSYISGSIYGEFCNSSEPTGSLPKEGWLVEAISADQSYIATTDENGHYTMRVDTGEYKIQVLPITDYWKTCIIGGQLVDVTTFYDTSFVDFQVAPEINCPYLEVDVSTPFLADCSEVIYTVRYCNLGTAVAEDAFVEITLDRELIFESSEIPFTNKVDNLYRFSVGDILVSECESFTINASLPCEGIAQGQASFVSAHIFPDTICTEPDPSWDRSSIIVGGNCIGQDSVQFFVKNVGTGGMQQTSTAVVVEGHIIFWQKPVRLGSQEEIATPTFPVNGFPHRIIAEQSPGHPGRSYPTLAIEGCGEEGVIQTGFVTSFPEDDLDPSISIDVQEINGSIETGAILRSSPKGYREDAIISPNTDLKYTVIFDNTTTDTMTRVVIRDTIPTGLDITSLQPGASSHPYRFEVYNEGIVKFTFDQILLPPHSSTIPTSIGYVSYTIKQNQDNAPGTTINHRAAVFSENVAPIITNVVKHTIGEADLSFIEKDPSVSVEVFDKGEIDILVHPNPFREYTMFKILSPEYPNNFQFQLNDYLGKVIEQRQFSGNQLMFDGSDLPKGIYIYQIKSNGRLLGSGKIIVE